MSNHSVQSAIFLGMANNTDLALAWIEYKQDSQNNSCENQNTSPPCLSKNYWIWQAITSNEQNRISMRRMVQTMKDVEDLRRIRYKLLFSDSSKEQRDAVRARLYELTNHNGFL